MNLIELIKDVHENAIKHGWWEKPRSFAELLLLVHSEISEALEELRNKHDPKEIYYEGHVKLEDGSILTMTRPMPEHVIYDNCNTIHVTKPCGFPTEFADVIIRLYDMAGWYKWSIDEQLIKVTTQSIKQNYSASQIRDGISDLHDDVVTMRRSRYPSAMAEYIIARVHAIAEGNGIDLDAAILEKHEYNKTRPYKHGGKLL